MRSRHHLLATIPDTCENVYARALVLDDSTEIVGSPKAFAVISTSYRLVVIVGDPEPSLLTPFHDSWGPGWTLLAESHEPRYAPEGWSWGRGCVHHLDEEHALRRATSAPAPIRPDVLTAAELGQLPDFLKRDLELAFVRTPIHVSRVNGEPVAFSCVTMRTETWFDISVDTLEAFRCQGHARIAAARAMAAQPPSMRPHWGAFEANVPSLRVAKALGFVEAGRRWAASKD